jgi:hypothetical protein
MWFHLNFFITFLVLCSNHIAQELITVAVHNQLWYLIWVQEASTLVRGFWSLPLQHGCTVCTEYVRFSFVCHCPNVHINCTYVWDVRSNMFVSWQTGSVMEMLATSGKVVCVTVYCHCLTLHTAVERHSLCQHIQTKTKIWIFQQCDMWVQICKLWYGRLYILHSHIWTLVIYSLRTVTSYKLCIAHSVVWP